jgi:(E)-4-hydroxy-3-methylbut-2-enyl-diphosphate synthase
MNTKPSKYCSSLFEFSRRKTTEVTIGNRVIGGDHPVLIQSMTTTNTKDIEATVAQTLELANAGCELVRITAPTAKDAEALEEIVKRVREAGCEVPISADIHFQPRAAMEAVKWVEKVRINPGNYVDKGIMFMKDWTEEEFAAGVQKVHDQFSPLVLEAKKRKVALRIGVNHGSLSGRMLFRFGDTVEGMVESAIEYLRVCEAHDFHNIVFSMKSSNAKVVIEAYRMLSQRLEQDHRPYPFHVGVTEAGEGEDGRLKSAVGIGGLLLDGLGETIRVSLTESPVEEIPVAKKLVEICHREVEPVDAKEFPVDPFHFNRRTTTELNLSGLKVGGDQPIWVGTTPSQVIAALPKERPLEWYSANSNSDRLESLTRFGTDGQAQVLQVSSSEIVAGSWPKKISNLEICIEDIKHLDLINLPKECNELLFSYVGQSNWLGSYRYLVAWLGERNLKAPIVLRRTLKNTAEDRMLTAANLGVLLCDGIGDLVHVEVEDQYLGSVNLAYDILQAAGLRRTKTEFISCPSCGRTLFDLEEVTAQIKAKTGHLKDVAIAVMGCIVNGPGEMADADFGYVGGAPGKIHLYVSKEQVQKNIPEDEATDALIELIKSHGRWTEPEIEPEVK